MERHDGPTVVTMVYATLLNGNVVNDMVLCATGGTYPASIGRSFDVRVLCTAVSGVDLSSSGGEKKVCRLPIWLVTCSKVLTARSHAFERRKCL